MGFEKAIESGKEHRRNFKDYNFAKYVDKNCRNHGNCYYCKSGRLYQINKEKEKAKNKMEDWKIEGIE